MPEPIADDAASDRRVVISSLLALALVFGFCAWSARRGEPPAWDRAIGLAAVRARADLPALTQLFRALTRIGDPDVALPTVLVAVTLWYALARARVVAMLRNDAIFFAGVALIGRLLIPALKLIFRRDRPPPADRLVVETSFSFPSGHGAFSGIALGLAFLAIRHALRDAPRRPRALALAAASATCVLIAASRVWLGVHYASDVIGGFALGLIWVIAARMLRSRLTHGVERPVDDA